MTTCGIFYEELESSNDINLNVNYLIYISIIFGIEI